MFLLLVSDILIRGIMHSVILIIGIVMRGTELNGITFSCAECHHIERCYGVELY
jgi:hypothetical protein